MRTASRRDPLAVLDEFRDMVKALHRAGIEVILDVVFNHTTEGGPEGPTLCYRGLANDLYYILERDKSRYADYSGCHNTLNANQSIVRRLIQDSLRYWVRQMHVDGFRFDLASILARDENGRPLPDPPVLWDIESDPELAGTKLIAEAWDAAGLDQVGSFVGDAWQEWNSRFRDDVRRFVRGDDGCVSRVAARILGSPDMFGSEAREAEQGVNFVTCHDGFTLDDLVSYDRKHNEANAANNRDGVDDNLSWNCGVEGPTDDPAIEALRNRQVKNFLALQLLAAGTPMILMGDEVRRSQKGNNNAYCQDSELSWFDWSLLDRHGDVLRFVKQLNAFRRHPDGVTEGRGAHSQPARSPGADRMARRRARPPRLERALALARLHLAKPGFPSPVPRDVERLLGAADVRAAGGLHGIAPGLAALHRHRPRAARRHQPLGERCRREPGDVHPAAALGGASHAAARTAARKLTWINERPAAPRDPVGSNSS